MADTHRYVGDHAAEIGGVMREPGEFLSLSKEQLEDAHVADAIDNGTIVDLKSFTSGVPSGTTSTSGEGGDKVNG